MNQEYQQFLNFKEFLQKLRITARQELFMKQMYKECILHDFELFYSTNIAQDEPENPHLLLWRPSNKNHEPENCIVFKIQGKFFQVKPHEQSSTGLLMRFLIQVYVKGKYECPYCYRKKKKIGNFIEVCNVCLQSCCTKCREKIKHCNNCKKGSGNYTMKFNEI